MNEFKVLKYKYITITFNNNNVSNFTHVVVVCKESEFLYNFLPFKKMMKF